MDHFLSRTSAHGSHRAEEEWMLIVQRVIQALCVLFVMKDIINLLLHALSVQRFTG